MLSSRYISAKNIKAHAFHQKVFSNFATLISNVRQNSVTIIPLTKTPHGTIFDNDAKF